MVFLPRGCVEAQHVLPPSRKGSLISFITSPAIILRISCVHHAATRRRAPKSLQTPNRRAGEAPTQSQASQVWWRSRPSHTNRLRATITHAPSHPRIVAVPRARFSTALWSRGTDDPEPRERHAFRQPEALLPHAARPTNCGVGANGTRTRPQPLASPTRARWPASSSREASALQTPGSHQARAGAWRRSSDRAHRSTAG